MSAFELGSLRFTVEHRNVGDDGGPALRVLACADAERELLRFDCFEKGAHFHVDPRGADAITRIDAHADAIEWSLSELRRDLAGYLKRAGHEVSVPPEREALETTLGRVEGEMRNPPLDLDDLDVARLRANPGEKWSLYPDDVLPAWVADMDFPVAEPIRRVLRRCADRSYFSYPVNPRPQDLPTLFAAHASERYGWDVEPRRVDVISDVVQGIYVALQQFSERGEGVAFQTPIYPPFFSAARDTKRRAVECPLVAGSDGFEVDFDALRSALGSGTRILLLSHPHNPTGRVFSRRELETFAELAIERDVFIVSDEIHADLVLPGRSHVPIATLGPEVESRTLTLMSSSKAFNIAGLRCAVAAFGSDAQKRRFNGIPRHTRGGINGIALAATDAAWRHSRPWLDRVLDYLKANRDFLATSLAERLPQVRYFPGDATYFAWLDCRGLALSPSPYEFFLERARVALSDGRSFGTPGDGFVRLNFATSRAILTEILERMARAVAARD
jgi:cystathionine beta-lyase